MARFHGAVGFSILNDNQETGIAGSTIVEKPYFGRVLEHTRRWAPEENGATDLTMGNQIAIVANDFAFQHASSIRYAFYMGSRWQVTSIRVKRPEIILTLGGVYHGPIQT